MHHLSRRQILSAAGLSAGGWLLGPILNRLHAEDRGKPLRTPRVVFVLQGNGCHPEQVHPASVKFLKRKERTEVQVIALADQRLAPALTALEPQKRLVTVLQGLSGRVTRGGHSTNLGALGAYQSGEEHIPRCAGPTIDWVLGRANPGVVPWMGVGLTGTGRSVRHNVSARAANKPLPIIHRPDHAFASYFGAIAEGTARQEFELKANLLDYLAGDVKRVRDQLGGIGRERLDPYLDAYEQLADRQSKLMGMRERLKAVAPKVDSTFTSQSATDILDAQFKIATAALIGGVTNVATIASSVGQGEFDVRFTGLGVEVTNHEIGHGHKTATMSNREFYEKIRAYHFTLIARMVDQLSKVKNGDGTLMDDTVIVYLSDAPEQHHSEAYEWPMVLVGNLGGKLRSGRLISYPDYQRKGHRTWNGVYNSLLAATGLADGGFGDDDRELGNDPVQRTPLPELMA